MKYFCLKITMFKNEVRQTTIYNAVAWKLVYQKYSSMILSSFEMHQRPTANTVLDAFIFNIILIAVLSAELEKKQHKTAKTEKLHNENRIKIAHNLLHNKPWQGTGDKCNTDNYSTMHWHQNTQPHFYTDNWFNTERALIEGSFQPITNHLPTVLKYWLAEHYRYSVRQVSQGSIFRIYDTLDAITVRWPRVSTHQR